MHFSEGPRVISHAGVDFSCWVMSNLGTSSCEANRDAGGELPSEILDYCIVCLFYCLLYVTVHSHLHLGRLADAFIQSDLQ